MLSFLKVPTVLLFLNIIVSWSATKATTSTRSIMMLASWQPTLCSPLEAVLGQKRARETQTIMIILTHEGNKIILSYYVMSDNFHEGEGRFQI